MSVAVSTAVWRHSASKGSSRLILLALADEANDEGLVTAYRRSQSHLARKINTTSLDTVRRAIRDLEALGELVVLAKGDGRASTDYQIVVEALQAKPPQYEAPQSDGPGFAPARPHPPQSDTPGVAPTRPPSSRSVPPLPGMPEAPRGRRSNPKHPIDPAFAITDEMRVWLATAALPGIDAEQETAKFVDHFVAKGEAKADWIAAWRNWMRNAATFARQRGGAPRPMAQRRDGDAREVAL